MRSRLAESLEHVIEQSRDVLEIDTTSLGRLIAQLKEGRRLPPSVFALYYDTVDALIEERLADAERLLTELGAQAPLRERLTVNALDPAILGAATVERYCRMVDTDPLSRFVFVTPSLDAVRSFRETLDQAMSLMERALPELAQEFHALVCEVVLAAGQSADGNSSFDGASSFLLWGALFVNPIGEHTPVSLIETLAHESAHSLLFGLSIDEPLVLNPDSERFKSPLRVDPRPMDGIYHATFVVARMHFAMSQLLASGLLDSAGIEQANSALERSRRAFSDGYKTVEEHGRLTKRGDGIIAGARGYFEAFA